MVQSILQRDCSGVYSFEEISATVLGFEKFSWSSEVLFFYPFSSLFNGVFFWNSQVLVILFGPKCSVFLIRSISSIVSFLLFFIIHMAHFSIPKLHSYKLPVYSYCLYKCLHFFCIFGIIIIIIITPLVNFSHQLLFFKFIYLYLLSFFF